MGKPENLSYETQMLDQMLDWFAPANRKLSKSLENKSLEINRENEIISAE